MSEEANKQTFTENKKKQQYLDLAEQSLQINSLQKQNEQLNTQIKDVQKIEPFQTVNPCEYTNLTENKQNSNQTETGERQNFSVNKNQEQKNQQTKVEKEKQIEEQIPDKFYDSDLASVNEKDFLSDKEPPKDIIHERKLLEKQKNYHIYKTIIKIGEGIDKPAPFDQIQLRYRKLSITNSEGLQQAKNIEYIQCCQFLRYNLGKKYSELQKFVISMKKGEISLFQLQWIEVSKKSNIKILKEREAFAIEVKEWITVVDIDNNSQILKYLIRRGEGPNRVSKYDEVSFDASIEWNGTQVWQNSYKLLKIEEETISQMQPIIWKTLSTMKKNQIAQVRLDDQHMRVVTGIENYQDQKQQQLLNKTSKYQQLISVYRDKKKQENETEEILEKQKPYQDLWKVRIQIKQYINIDDVYMNGKLLKKLLVKGVSTAKPDNQSLIYYALQYLDDQKNLLQKDPFFDSDWWEDYTMLDKLGCRKCYMDQYKMSKMLKNSMERMKPAQISEIQCRDLALFQYGHDYEELKSLWPKEKEFPPKKVYMVIRVYNFTEGKNCFNMVIDQKIQESKRKKLVAVKLLNEGKVDKALKIFENIVSYYNSGDINQTAYEEKISALMNSILCLMKLNQFSKMIPLCNIVLEKPRHGFNQDKMKINGQGVKVEGNLNNVEEQLDDRELANLEQNKKIVEKCLYRKALALLKIGQSKQSIQCLDKIENKSDQVTNLKLQAEKHFQNYQQKSKKIFKNMFGA